MWGERSAFNTQSCWVKRVHYMDRQQALTQWALWTGEISYSSVSGFGTCGSRYNTGDTNLSLKILKLKPFKYISKNKILENVSLLMVVVIVLRTNDCINFLIIFTRQQKSHNMEKRLQRGLYTIYSYYRGSKPYTDKILKYNCWIIYISHILKMVIVAMLSILLSHYSITIRTLQCRFRMSTTVVKTKNVFNSITRWLSWLHF